MLADCDGTVAFEAGHGGAPEGAGQGPAVGAGGSGLDRPVPVPESRSYLVLPAAIPAQRVPGGWEVPGVSLMESFVLPARLSTPWRGDLPGPAVSRSAPDLCKFRAEPSGEAHSDKKTLVLPLDEVVAGWYDESNI